MLEQYARHYAARAVRFAQLGSGVRTRKTHWSASSSTRDELLVAHRPHPTQRSRFRFGTHADELEAKAKRKPRRRLQGWPTKAMGLLSPMTEVKA